jgi:hypothetical protein
MQVYPVESSLLRVEKLEGSRGADAVEIYKDIVDVFIYDAAGIIRKSGYDAANSFATGEQYQKLAGYIDFLTKISPFNIKAARRRIAAKLIEDNRYDFK